MSSAHNPNLDKLTKRQIPDLIKVCPASETSRSKGKDKCAKEEDGRWEASDRKNAVKIICYVDYLLEVLKVAEKRN